MERKTRIQSGWWKDGCRGVDLWPISESDGKSRLRGFLLTHAARESPATVEVSDGPLPCPRGYISPNGSTDAMTIAILELTVRDRI